MQGKHVQKDNKRREDKEKAGNKAWRKQLSEEEQHVKKTNKKSTSVR